MYVRLWWNNVVMTTFTHKYWQQNFRMYKETFLYICNHLLPELERIDTFSCKDHCLYKMRIDVCLWCFTTPIEYCIIAHLFGIGQSTVCDVVHETCRATVMVLMKEYVKFPYGGLGSYGGCVKN